MSGKGFEEVPCRSDDASEAAEKENKMMSADGADTAMSNAAGHQVSVNAMPDAKSPDGQVSDDNQSTASDAEGSGGEAKQKEQTYSQAEVDALKRQVEDLEKQRSAEADRLSQAQDALQKTKKDLDEATKIPSQLSSAISAIYRKLGSLTHAEIFPVAWELADLQLKMAEMAALRRERDDAVRCLELEKNETTRLREEKAALQKEKKTLGDEHAKLVCEKGMLEEKNKDLQESLDGWTTIGNQLLGAAIPEVLKGKDWWAGEHGLQDELLDALYSDPPSDAAMLVWASLSEFAVFERMPDATPIEADKLGKQLSDIGYVVANYARQKHGTEDAVVQMLRMFMESLNESPFVKGKEFGLKVPAFGDEVNTDEMKSLKGGTTVNKVVNWCITKNGRVYSKAVVE